MSNPLALRWITKCRLELIGITGDFCITETRPMAGWTNYTLKIRNSKDRFIYELHGGDAIVWNAILKEYADFRMRVYFPDSAAAKAHRETYGY